MTRVIFAKLKRSLFTRSKRDFSPPITITCLSFKLNDKRAFVLVILLKLIFARIGVPGMDFVKIDRPQLGDKNLFPNETLL